MTKQFTQEFKANAVKRFLELKEAGKTIPEIEKEIGVGNSSLYMWTIRAKEQSRQVTRATMLPTTTEAPAGKAPEKLASGKYPDELRERGLQLIASGKKVPEVSRQLKVSPQTVHYWVKAAKQSGRVLSPPDVVQPREQPKPANGIGSGGAMTDALIYLRHAEKEIMDMVREGKISRPDQAHLLTLLALGALQKSIAK